MAKKNYYLHLALALLILLAAPCQAAAQVISMPDSIREVESAPASGKFARNHPYVTRTALNAAELDTPIDFEVALRLRNFSELQQRVAHGEHIAPAQMAARYDPTQADYDQAVGWLQSQGFVITQQDPTHLAVFAQGSARQIRQRTGAHFARVAYQGREFTSAVSAPSVPTALAQHLVGINGLQTHLFATRHIVAQPASLSGTNPPYLPSQIAQAYDATSLYSGGLSGAGECIAIVIDTFPATSDLTTFWSTYGVSQSLNNVTFIQAVNGTLPAPSGEESLDTEWCSSIAPGANVRVYASTSLSLNKINQTYSRVYQDARAHPEYNIHEMSMSFGVPENYLSNSFLATDAQYFSALAALGVTLFASSGDQGATPDPSNQGLGPSPESPACDPSVTGVGGTSLVLDSGGRPASEVVWNNNSGASGGGISQYFNRPSWQVGNGVPSGSTRLVPDVALTADPYYGAVVTLNGSQVVYGGTSWSSPAWAGFAALLNQGRISQGKSPFGILPPFLYPLLGTPIFRDVTSGSNAYNGGTGYNAGAGYDLATGIGVPDMAQLAAALGVSPPLASDTPAMPMVALGFLGLMLLVLAGRYLQVPRGA